MSCLWIPVALLLFARVNRGERPVSNAALCGTALGAGFVMGHHNVPIYLVVTLGVGVGVAVGQAQNGAAAVCVAVWLMVSAVQTLRWVGIAEPLSWTDRVPYSVHAEYSLQAQSLPGIVFPGFAIHASPFVGIVALMLAMAAVEVAGCTATFDGCRGGAAGGVGQGHAAALAGVPVHPDGREGALSRDGDRCAAAIAAPAGGAAAGRARRAGRGAGGGPSGELSTADPAGTRFPRMLGESTTRPRYGVGYTSGRRRRTRRRSRCSGRRAG
jgi:hypothetical protein